MELNNFSLIYPNAGPQGDRATAQDAPNIDMFVLEELGLLDLIDLKNS